MKTLLNWFRRKKQIPTLPYVKKGMLYYKDEQGEACLKISTIYHMKTSGSNDHRTLITGRTTGSGYHMALHSYADIQKAIKEEK